MCKSLAIYVIIFKVREISQRYLLHFKKEIFLLFKSIYILLDKTNKNLLSIFHNKLLPLILFLFFGGFNVLLLLKIIYRKIVYIYIIIAIRYFQKKRESTTPPL